MKYFPIAGCALLGTMLGVAACSGDKPGAAPAPASSAASAAKPRGASAAEQTVAMVLAPTNGKASAPMQLKFELTDRPVAGQTISLGLALLAGVPAQSVTLHFDNSPGITYADQSDRQIGAVVPDTVYRQDVKLSAPTEGVYFVAVSATMTHDAIVETRAFSIPIVVSPP